VAIENYKNRHMKIFYFNTALPPDYIKRDYFSSLDGFRAISILAVVYSHVYFNEDNFVAGFFSGDWGVHFFFVICGFL
jgi:peptidoglycan/LPS O-acetylase OafA/YrhL